MPYLDTLRWVFTGVALVGIGVAVYATTGRGGGGDQRGSAGSPAASARHPRLATERYKQPAIAACPPVVEFSAEFRARAAEELERLPERSGRGFSARPRCKRGWPSRASVMVEFADFNQEPREPRMMELEVEAVMGARFMLRATNRNGYRERGWETRTGRIELAISPRRDSS